MKKNYVLTSWEEQKSDFDNLTALEFIKKYAEKLNGIYVEFHGYVDPAMDGILNAHYRPNWAHAADKEMVASNPIGNISDDEVMTILSRYQWNNFVNGKEYRFFIDPVFIDTEINSHE